MALCPQIPTYYSLYGMGPFGSLQGHYIIHIDIASEVKSDLKFEISGSNYLLIHEHIAYMVWALLASSEATTAPKQPQRSNPNYLSMCILLIWYGSFWQPEATKASKQLQRSNMTSDLKPVTPITYLSMCILILCCGPFWQPQRPLQPRSPNLTSDLK